MAIPFPPHNMSATHKHIRRSATTVMAGAFDPRPPRDVLTSLLNGVGPYKEVERDEEERAKRKQEKKELKRQERKRIKAALRAQRKELEEASQHATVDASFASTSSLPHHPSIVNSSGSSFWRAISRPVQRPTIHIPSQPSLSVTPSPSSSPRRHPSTPGTTPGPSISSSTSRTSSKRPHTPDEEESYMTQSARPIMSAPPRKKRTAAKKGWKGWVEGSPPPSEKLINLDSAPILQDRRLRSGKNFDGVGPGAHGWV